jgi:ribosome-binding protein aMBF1 (putative translation factor)
MTTDPLGRPDRLQVTVAPAGWPGVLIRPDGHTVWTCRHSHPSTLEARQCAERERQLPGLTDLGFRLRALREAAGLSQAQAAAALECSDSKVSRIETGEVLASTRDVRGLASLYRVAPAERDQLVTAARKGRAARNRGQDPDRPDPGGAR